MMFTITLVYTLTVSLIWLFAMYKTVDDDPIMFVILTFFSVGLIVGAWSMLIIDFIMGVL